ncbi:hypothetical protein MN608_09349 [Microdochium nivale]|nr:hypothetical protein MN608_09349 [Microdochium nivale]
MTTHGAGTASGCIGHQTLISISARHSTWLGHDDTVTALLDAGVDIDVGSGKMLLDTFARRVLPWQAVHCSPPHL